MALKGESNGIIEQQGYFVKYTGMGLISAAQICTEEILNHKPDAVFNFGTAGSTHFSVGDLIEITQFCQRGDVLPQTNSFIRTSAITNLKTGFCGSADFVEVAKNTNQYNVYDMEAFAMAQVCRNHQIPFHCFKLITDRSDEQLKQDWKKNLEVSRYRWVDLIQILDKGL